MSKRFESRLLVAALVLCTLLWGTAVAAHHHFADETQHCEICLLPHAANVPDAAIELPDNSPAGHDYSFNQSTYTPRHTSFYWGRAPPSLSSSI